MSVRTHFNVGTLSFGMLAFADRFWFPYAVTWSELHVSIFISRLLSFFSYLFTIINLGCLFSLFKRVIRVGATVRGCR